jgi:hypothetical protein
MADLSQMGQLTSKETTGFHIPTNEHEASLPTTPGFSFIFPINEPSEPKSSPPTSTLQTTEAASPSAFTPQTKEPLTSLTVAQQLEIAQRTILMLTSENAQLKDKILTLKKEIGTLGDRIHKIRKEKKQGSTHRGRAQDERLWNQLRLLVSDTCDVPVWYDRLRGNPRLAQLLLRVNLCTNGNNCPHGDNCHFAHSTDQQTRARSNWDCPNEGCTGGKCMWKHPEDTVS